MAVVAATSSSGDNRENQLVPTLLKTLVAGMSDPNRLSRGRTYARQGAVDELDVHDGIISGSVQGSRAQPYEVTVRARPADSFDSLIKLVPERNEISFLCSCPDWDDPCKHAVAVVIAFADLVAEDPDLLRTWRGKTRGGSGERAVIGSRTGSTSAPTSTDSGPARLDPAVAAALGSFLGEPADYEIGAVSHLAPPNAAWGELWAEMLTDALDKLADNG
jgi:hypothetical protein